MARQAYISLIEDHWAVVTGGAAEGVEVLAVGRPFEAGADIRAALAELEDWASTNGFELTTPEYTLDDWSLLDLIEPEIFDEVFGTDDDQDAR